MLKHQKITTKALNSKTKCRICKMKCNNCKRNASL